MQELINAVGGERVGIKLSPLHPYGDMILNDPEGTYTYLISELNQLDFNYVELMNAAHIFLLQSIIPLVMKWICSGKKLSKR